MNTERRRRAVLVAPGLVGPALVAIALTLGGCDGLGTVSVTQNGAGDATTQTTESSTTDSSVANAELR